MKDVLKVGVSGVRGVVGETFTPQLAAAFAQAFGSFVGRGLVLVGRDTRPSGSMIEQAVVAGLQSVGCKPVLAGVVPTPTMLLLTTERGARGGIVITASHNAAPWNALKFIGPDGLFLSQGRADELFDIYHQQQFPLTEESDIPRVEEERYPVESHFKKITSYVDRLAIESSGLKVAVDGCNGVGALYSPLLIRSLLKCELVPLYDTPSGRFERDPEPLPEHLDRLCQVVVDQRCDIGFAQDPDGDRLAVVDENGVPVGENMTLALAIRQVLARHRKGPIAVNMSTSSSIETIAAEFGQTVYRTKIGEINVARALIDHQCAVGGEHNGGIMIPDIHPCRDSFAGMAVIMEALAQSRKKTSELCAEIPIYHTVRTKLEVRGVEATHILREIRKSYDPSQVNLLDGLFINLNNAWLHVRRSNTEPVMRISSEAPTREEAESMVRDMQGRIEAMLAGMRHPRKNGSMDQP